MLRSATVRLGRFGFMPHPPVEANPVVFMDVTAGNSHLGRVTIELFSDVVPRSAENVRSLCTGERGNTRWVPGRSTTACPLTYKGIPFHRIVPGFAVQGGDILHKDGRGNESIFGYEFDDECLDGKAGEHLEGTVALASSGPNANGSQFFFNLTRSPQLDGKFVVVGQVVDGWSVVQEMARSGSRCGTPVRPVWISECGQSGGAQLEDLARLDTTREEMPGKEVLDMLRPRS